jgi:ELWxxDGT repeat protein
MKSNTKTLKNIYSIIGVVLGAMALSTQSSAQEMLIPELVKDIVSGAGGSNPAEFVAIGEQTFFVATTANEGKELWKTDGTPEGTMLVKDIYPGTTGSSPSDLTAVGGTLFFIANDGVTGRELWKSDGTSNGTVLVKDFWTIGNPGGPAPSELTNFNGVLFLSAPTWDEGQELWKSDGTTTQIVSDYLPGGTNSFPTHLTVVNNTLFYSALPGAFDGPELFKSDGNTISVVKDIYPGTTGSSPSDLTAVGGTLFFVANDGVTGRELWESDGTSNGTVLVEDLYPGISASSPANLASAMETLFFSADDGIAGREPWKLGTAPLTPVELIENLKDQVLGLNLPNGLVTKLNEALNVLSDDNQNNDHVAINKLKDFINQVNGQRGKRISEGDADSLIAAAEDIILLLQG